MRIAFFEAEDWEREAARRLERANALTYTSDPLTAGNAASCADAEVVTVFIRSDLSAATLAQLPRLKLIVTRSTGYDHIDLDYCRRTGVVVCNIPDYGDSTVAEHAFALLLAVSRRIVDAARRTREGDFSIAGLRGFDLACRTMGVVGAGRIGQRVIQIARGFGMEVVAADPRPDADLAARLGFAYLPLPELLAVADVVSIHVPGGPDTRNLISDPEFALMKPGAVLINTARGGIVDPEALIRALTGGRLSGAGLDVLVEEALVREEAEIFRAGVDLQADKLRSLVAVNALLRFPNVIATPHIAYDTQEATGRIVETALANIEAFIAGTPRNVVGA